MKMRNSAENVGQNKLLKKHVQNVGKKIPQMPSFVGTAATIYNSMEKEVIS